MTRVEVQLVAKDISVSLAKGYMDKVMDVLLVQLQPNIGTFRPVVVNTLGSLAKHHPHRIVPFLEVILATTAHLVKNVKVSDITRRVSFAEAVTHFCNALLDMSNISQMPCSSVTLAQHNTEADNIYDQLFTSWMPRAKDRLGQVDGVMDGDSDYEDDETSERTPECLPPLKKARFSSKVDADSTDRDHGSLAQEGDISGNSSDDFQIADVDDVRSEHSSEDLQIVNEDGNSVHSSEDFQIANDADLFENNDISDDSDLSISQKSELITGTQNENPVTDCHDSDSLANKSDPKGPLKDISVFDFNSDHSDSGASDDDFEIADDFEMFDPVEISKVKCCLWKCNNLHLSEEIRTQLQNLTHQKKKIDIKNELLFHLQSQHRMGLTTSGFWFGGSYLCAKYFSEMSGISLYILTHVMEDHEAGRLRYEHGNNNTVQFSLSSIGFINWMRSFADLYGQSAPDSQVNILPSWLKIKDLFEIYCDEVEEPKVKSSTFYSLFHKCFGWNRQDKTLPHIRLSAWSSHSRCDQCIALSRYQRSCRTEESIAQAKALKMAHKECYGKARLSIESLRHLALEFPQSRLFIQIDDMGKRSCNKCNFKCFSVSLRLVQMYNVLNFKPTAFPELVCHGEYFGHFYWHVYACVHLSLN